MAGGISKSNSIIGSLKKNNPNALSIPQYQLGLGKENSIKSRSHVPLTNKERQFSKHLDVNEVELEIEDENKNFFFEENFKHGELFVGTCPFQHWSLYRQQI